MVPGTTGIFEKTFFCAQELKQETEVLWFEFELQHSQHSQLSPQQTEEGAGVEQVRAQLVQQWRSQQICLQTRYSSTSTFDSLLRLKFTHSPSEVVLRFTFSFV